MKKKQLLVRFVDSINIRIRPLALYHGDLSILVEEAITAADVATMKLIKLPRGARPAQDDGLARHKLGNSTTLLISEITLKRIERTAKTRKQSKNVIVNSALLWWLDNASHRLLRA